MNSNETCDKVAIPVIYHHGLPEFDYICPATFQEALDLVGTKHEGRSMVYAGGTDIIPRLKKRMLTVPKQLIDLKQISGLDYIRFSPKQGLTIGALATVRSVANSPLVQQNYPMLAQAAASIGSTQIQNRATIVGNVCSAVPSADSPPALLALNARVICASSKGERVISLSDFFQGPRHTVLDKDEIVKELQVPTAPSGAEQLYIKLSPRKRMDLALVGVAVMIVAEDNLCKQLRIGLGAVAPTPIRAKKAEAILVEKPLNGKIIEEMAEIAADEAIPIDDHRASAAYRRAMIKVLVKRAVQGKHEVF